jgi:hypothetical protein
MRVECISAGCSAAEASPFAALSVGEPGWDSAMAGIEEFEEFELLCPGWFNQFSGID